MYFCLGGRQCIGKTVAQTNTYKLTSTLLRLFDFRLADAEERLRVAGGEFGGKLPDLLSVGISDIKKPLLVTARVRD